MSVYLLSVFLCFTGGIRVVFAWLGRNNSVLKAAKTKDFELK